MSQANRFVLKHALEVFTGGWPWGRESKDLPAPYRLHAAPLGGRRRRGDMLADAVFVCMSAITAYCLGHGLQGMARLLWIGASGPPASGFQVQEPYGALLLVYVTLVLFANESQEVYRAARVRTNMDETLAILKAVALATLVLAAFIFLSGAKGVSLSVVFLSGLLNVTSLAAWRIWRRGVITRRVSNEKGGRNALIVGVGQTGQELARYLSGRKDLGYVVKGFLDGNHPIDRRVLGHIEDLPRIVRSEFVDDIFITVPSEQGAVRAVSLEARGNRLGVKLVPEFYDELGRQAPLEYLGDFPMIELCRKSIPRFSLLAKRAVDVMVATAGLVLLSPLLAVTAVAIKLDDPGPALYRAVRIGKKGRKFVCYKFRSMVSDADCHKEDLRHLNERSGPFFKISNDPRQTRVGKFLRKFSVDELPQFWNVFKGDMSLVGPRPHPIDDFEKYQMEHLRRLDVTPGITGLWQVVARRDPSFERNMRLDLEYIENWNFWLDLKILLKTVPTVLSGTGE